MIVKVGKRGELTPKENRTTISNRYHKINYRDT